MKFAQKWREVLCLQCSVPFQQISSRVVGSKLRCGLVSPCFQRFLCSLVPSAAPLNKIAMATEECPIATWTTNEALNGVT